MLNGKSYQALLPESSPLFVGVVTHDVEALSEELSADPGIALRVYNVLEWSSDGSKPEQATDTRGHQLTCTAYRWLPCQ
jgi:hypothetical protein